MRLKKSRGVYKKFRGDYKKRGSVDAPFSSALQNSQMHGIM